MAVKLQKLDKRFDGHQFFKYRAKVDGTPGDKQLEFARVRNWMIDTYGKSTELDMYVILKYRTDCDEVINHKWVWKNDEYGSYIYLADDEKLLNWFTMRWI